MLGVPRALGCFSGFSKVKSVLAIQLWKAWLSAQSFLPVPALLWMCQDCCCVAPSQADFNNNNTSIFLGTSVPSRARP